MKKWLHETAYDVIYKDSFEHLCLDYGKNPVIALKDLSQDKLNSNGNNVCMTVHVYDTQFWNFTRHLHATDVDDYGQDLCSAYLAVLNIQVKRYVERKYSNFHRRVDTAYDVQCAALKVIFDHTYKGKQESISFALNLTQHLLGADGSMFVASVVVPGAAMKPDAASHPSRAEKTFEKYLSGPSKGKIKHGDYFGCGSNDHLAMEYNKKHVPEVAARIDAAVAKMSENNKL